jgi:uncharacterized protein
MENLGYTAVDFQHNGFYIKSLGGYFMSENNGPFFTGGQLFLTYEQADLLQRELQEAILKKPPYLEVKKSKIPNAGDGLFTKKKFFKGDKIVEYLGEIIDYQEYSKRTEDDKYGYMLYIDRKTCIDAYNTPQFVARYANDASGLKRVPGLKNNCEYEIDGRRAYIIAKQDIKAGEELFVNYGKEYWDDIKHNLSLKKD